MGLVGIYLSPLVVRRLKWFQCNIRVSYKKVHRNKRDLGMCSKEWLTRTDSYNNWSTSNERISLVARLASTIGNMIYHIANSVHATRTGAWINTTFVCTRFCIWTVGINATFGTTVWWSAIVVWQTMTNRRASNIITLTKIAAWIWHASIHSFILCWRYS